MAPPAESDDELFTRLLAAATKSFGDEVDRRSGLRFSALEATTSTTWRLGALESATAAFDPPQAPSPPPSVDPAAVLISVTPLQRHGELLQASSPSTITAATPSAIDDKPSDTNSGAPTTCSTKCPVGVVAAIGGYPVPEELVVNTTGSTATPTATTVAPSVVTSCTPIKCSMTVLDIGTSSSVVSVTPLHVAGLSMDVPAPMVASEFSPSKLLVDIELGPPSPIKCSVVGLNDNTYIPSSASVLGTAQNILQPQSMHSDRVLLCVLPVEPVGWQPCPKPMLLGSWHDISIVRLAPWLSFTRVNSSTENMDFSWLWKPPWPSLFQDNISYAIEVVMFYHGDMLLKTPWPPVLLDITPDGVMLQPTSWSSLCCNNAEKKSKLLLLMGADFNSEMSLLSSPVESRSITVGVILGKIIPDT